MMSPFAADRPLPSRPPQRRAARAMALADQQALPTDRQLAGVVIAAALSSLALWALAALSYSTF
jgi:hypothetical protein